MFSGRPTGIGADQPEGPSVPKILFFRKPPPVQFVDEKEMKEKRPVEMKPEMSRAFVSSYEQMMMRQIFYEPLGQKTSYRWLILNQVRRFGRYLENPENEYTPMVWEK